LKQALGTEADATVFRKLAELSYRTSYSHRGRFYTLDEIAAPAPLCPGHLALGYRPAAAYAGLSESNRRFIEMMWGYYAGWSWLLMAATMVVFWGGIAAVAVFAIRAFTGARGSDAAMDVLRRRLASGEITQEEFEKTRRVLQG